MLQNLAILKVLRAWVEISDEPALVVPAFATLGSVQVSESGTALMQFSSRIPEVDALVMGRKYLYESKKSAIAVLELTSNNTKGQAEDITNSSGYILETQDPKTTSAIAYYAPLSSNQEATPLEIVSSGNIKGANQIAIGEAGYCEISSNLIGKKIKIRVPVVYPEAVLITQSPIEKLVAHLVVLWSDESIKYVGLPSTPVLGSRSANLKTMRLLTLKFAPKDVIIRDLCGS